jgi:uncharacterized repeat protein (TIGR03803 family)
VFKLSANGALTSLYSFIDSYSRPSAELVQGSDGNLYGTTSGGGAYAVGTVFQITTNMTLTTLYYLGLAPKLHCPLKRGCV